jgi:hypothetical protein
MYYNEDSGKFDLHSKELGWYNVALIEKVEEGPVFLSRERGF